MNLHSMRYFVLGFMFVMSTTLTADAATVCPVDPKTEFGDVLLNVSKIEVNATCSFTISNVNKTKQMSVEFMVSESKDQFDVYDGIYDASINNTNIVYKYAGEGESVWLVTFSDVTSFVYKRLGSATPKITIHFDSKTCVKNVDSRQITPPLYLPKDKAEVKCMLDVNLVVNMTEYQKVLSFLEFDLPHSDLTILGKENRTLTGIVRPDDFFYTEDDLKLSLSMKQLNVTQTFSIVLSQTIAKCTEMVTVNLTTGLDFTIDIPSQHDLITECRQIFTSNNKKTLKVELMAVKLQGADSLIMVDGGSQGDRNLVGATSRLDSTATGTVLLTSGNKLWVRTVVDTLPGERSVKIRVSETDAGGRFYDGGKITVGASTKGLTAADSSDYYYQLITSSQVQLKMKDTKITGTIDVYDGLQATNLLTSFGPNSKFFPVTASANEMLIVARNFTNKDQVPASYANVVESCDLVTSESKGSFSITELKDKQACRWTISPQNQEGVTVLQFSIINLRQNDTLSISTLASSKAANVLASFKGPTMLDVIPQINLPANVRTMVTFTTKYKCENGSVCTNPTILASFDTTQDCKKTLSPPSGVVTSPNWPNIYPVNAKCVWSDMENKTTSEYKMLHMSFTQLDLPFNHSLTLHSSSGKTNLTHAKFTGSQLPKDVIAKGDNYQLTFSSVQKTTNVQAMVGEGFQANYRYLECGGNIGKAKGTIQSPKYPKVSNKTMVCAWIVKLPKQKNGTESKDIIQFDLVIDTKNKSNPAVFGIHDGASIRDPVFIADNAQNKSSLTTGNKTRMMSRTNTILIFYDMSLTPDLIFHLNYSTHKCGKFCDNGVCLHENWYCNGYDECGDNTDERHCVYPNPPTTMKPEPRKGGKSGGVAGYWVALCLLFGIILGVVGTFVVPNIIKRLRFRNYNHLHEVSNPVA